MKYLDSHELPRYRRITEQEMPGTDESRMGLMELEADEMLYTGEMKKKLWIKCLDKEQYKQLIDEEAQARIETLDKLIRVWEEV